MGRKILFTARSRQEQLRENGIPDHAICFLNPTRSHQEAVRIPETVSRKVLAAGENTANNRRLAPNRSQEQSYRDTLLVLHRH